MWEAYISSLYVCRYSTKNNFERFLLVKFLSEMNSSEDIKYVTDEERNKEFEIERGEGEEAARGLSRNGGWNTCYKLKTDPTYHQRYIPINDALCSRHLTSEDKEVFVKGHWQ